MKFAVASVQISATSGTSEEIDMTRTMNAILDVFARFLHSRCGATAIEYTLIASIISIAIMVGAGMLGTSTRTLFGFIATEVSQATNR